jgi:hypothetical protein
LTVSAWEHNLGSVQTGKRRKKERKKRKKERKRKKEKERENKKFL